MNKAGEIFTLIFHGFAIIKIYFNMRGFDKRGFSIHRLQRQKHVFCSHNFYHYLCVFVHVFLFMFYFLY